MKEGYSLFCLLFLTIIVGIAHLSQVVPQIQKLYLSNCGLTSLCGIESWTFQLKEVDLTGNAIESDQFISRLNNDCFIRLDDYKVKKKA